MCSHFTSNNPLKIDIIYYIVKLPQVDQPRVHLKN